MTLCRDDITPCWIGAKKVALGGYFHLLQAPFGNAVQKNIVNVHCLDLVSQRVRHRHHILAAFAAAAKMSVRCTNDA
jgi:hypothetical protein